MRKPTFAKKRGEEMIAVIARVRAPIADKLKQQALDQNRSVSAHIAFMLEKAIAEGDK